MEEVFRGYKRVVSDGDDDGHCMHIDNHCMHIDNDSPNHTNHSLPTPHIPTIHPSALVVTLIGAGRGPLILCSLRAARAANRPILVQAVEKNANALVTLRRLHRELRWGEHVILISGDGRSVETPYRCDVLLSELLGSLGDNELAPECLVAARNLLLPGGVCIPAEHTSFLAPCMSSRIFSNVHSRGNSHVGAENQSESGLAAAGSHLRRLRQ